MDKNKLKKTVNLAISYSTNKEVLEYGLWIHPETNVEYYWATFSAWNIWHGWEVVGLVINEKLVAKVDGIDQMKIHNKDIFSQVVTDEYDAEEIFVNEMRLEHLGWHNLAEKTREKEIENIRKELGDKWVLILNSNESETDEGFSDTYYIKDSKPNQKSPYGWRESSQVKNLPEHFNDELIQWAKIQHDWSLD
jgi:hypothetical protein